MRPTLAALLFMDKATRKKLASGGILAKAKDDGDDKRVNLTGIDVGYGSADLALRFGVLPPPYPPAEAKGTRSMVLPGFNTLRHMSHRRLPDRIILATHAKPGCHRIHTIQDVGRHT